MLAGFSPAARPNAAIEELDKAIDRDVESQKAEMGKKSTLLSANMQHFRDLSTAMEMTRTMQMGAVAEKMKAAAAKAGDPQAKAALLGQIATYDMSIQTRLEKVAARQAMQSALAGSSGKPNEQRTAQTLNVLRTYDPAKAKELEALYVPGVGMATTPVNDKTREAFSAGNAFVQQMDQLEKFRKEHRGALIGAAADEGHRLSELARNSFRIAQGEGVFKQGSQQFNERLIPDPTNIDIFGKNKNAYSDMKNRALGDMQSAARVHGIKAFEDSVLVPKESQYLDWAKNNPTDPRAKVILRNARGK